MRISYLELRNYRKFKELKLQFPDGIVGILGLNGVGKTTIIEGIAWALFGNVDEVVRTSRESVRRAGADSHDPCSAVLEFELGGVEYRIEREMGGRNLSMKAVLRSKSKILADGDKPVRKMVEKLIGMDHKSFFTSVFARQKELNALQNVAPGERKKVVLRMLRIDGIDTVLAEVRSDKRNTESRIEGSERTLLTEDGREREKVLEEKLPELKTQHELCSRTLEETERIEELVSRALEDIRKRRDELRKDVDAYNSSSSELKARQSSIRELKERVKSITSKISAAEVQLKRMPNLEKSEAEWKSVSEKKELMEKEKNRFEKAKSIKQEIETDGDDISEREVDLAKLMAEQGEPRAIEDQIAEVDKSRLECEATRSEMSSKIGGVKAKMAQKKSAAEEDRVKLNRIVSAGKEGVCPTCERRLDEAYELLTIKLGESIESAERETLEASSELSRLEADLSAVAKKDEALRKKRARLEEDLGKLRQLQASRKVKETELERMRNRLAQRTKALADLGHVTFSEGEYRKAKIEHERLRLAHDEYTKMRGVMEQMEHNIREQASIRESIARVETEETTLKGIVMQLEPKKGLYDAAIKDFDEKTAAVASAKDAARKAGLAKEKARSELERATNDLVEIARVKKAIENDRKTVDDFALLEDVLVTFRDDLIGRIAPTLSELTSRSLGVMTDGKYTTAALDDNYEMQIDDQGTMHPISRFSGGEADLANLSLRLAISSIIADRTGASPVNILILDEIFGSQDPNRKRSVMAALSRLSTQFRQIFLITHIEEVKDAMSSVVNVEELEDGTSRAMLAS